MVHEGWSVVRGARRARVQASAGPRTRTTPRRVANGSGRSRCSSTHTMPLSAAHFTTCAVVSPSGRTCSRRAGTAGTRTRSVPGSTWVRILRRQHAPAPADLDHPLVLRDPAERRILGCPELVVPRHPHDLGEPRHARHRAPPRGAGRTPHVAGEHEPVVGMAFERLHGREVRRQGRRGESDRAYSGGRRRLAARSVARRERRGQGQGVLNLECESRFARYERGGVGV
jgi:hypothetical protein